MNSTLEFVENTVFFLSRKHGKSMDFDENSKGISDKFLIPDVRTKGGGV